MKPAILLILGGCGFPLSPTKRTFFNSYSYTPHATTNLSTDFDVNDVAFLYPLNPNPISNPNSDGFHTALSPTETRENASELPDSLLPTQDFKSLLCDALTQAAPHVQHPFSKPPRPNAPQSARNPFRPLKKICGPHFTKAFTNPKEVYVTADLPLSLGDVFETQLWKVVGFRIEFCFGNGRELQRLLETAPPKRIHFDKPLPPDYTSKCQALLRVVAQPLAPLQHSGFPAWGALNHAMHLLYRVPHSRVHDLITDLLAIKWYAHSLGGATHGKPQFIHPGFSAQSIALAPNRPSQQKPQSTTLPFATALNTFLKKYAIYSHLTDINMFNSLVVLEKKDKKTVAGVYSQFKKHTTNFKITGIPMIKSSYPLESQTVQFHVAEGQGSTSTLRPPVAPLYTVRPHLPFIGPLLDIALNPHPPNPLFPHLQEALERSHAIDNPYNFNLKSMDCVSCHTATPYRTAVTHRLGKRGPPLPPPPFTLPGISTQRPPHLYADHIEATTKTSREPLAPQTHFPNLMAEHTQNDHLPPPRFQLEAIQRHFGYFQLAPMVSQRAINESAVNAHFINQLVELETYMPELVKSSILNPK